MKCVCNTVHVMQYGNAHLHHGLLNPLGKHLSSLGFPVCPTLCVFFAALASTWGSPYLIWVHACLLELQMAAALSNQMHNSLESWTGYRAIFTQKAQLTVQCASMQSRQVRKEYDQMLNQAI